MYFLTLAVPVYLTAFIFLYKKYFTSSIIMEPGRTYPYAQIAVLLSAFLFRMIISANTSGYETDMNCWCAWSERAFSQGLIGFYSEDYFCDYPPGYIYFLSVLGALRHMLPFISDALILKLPAIIFDIITICIFAKTLDVKNVFSVIFALLFGFCPAIWVNSSVWGQVDAVFTLALILSLLGLLRKNYYISAFWFSISILFKPQALLIAPIYLLTVIENCHEEKVLKKLLGSIGIFFITFLTFSLPFTIGKEPFFILKLYLGTLSSYKYASLNAFNLFTLLGANGVDIESLFWGLPYSIWGLVGILIAVIFASILFIKGRDSSKYFYASATLFFGIFMLGTKMHERYLFPAVIFFFFAFCFRKDKRILLLSFLISILHFLNVSYMYTLSLSEIYYALSPNKTASILSLLHLALYAYSIYLGLTLYNEKKVFHFEFMRRIKKIFKCETFRILFIVLLYGIISFINLGNSYAPKTPASTDNIADFGCKAEISSVSVYKGIGDCNIYFEFSDDGKTWSSPRVFEGSDCFKWESYVLNTSARFVRVRFTGQSENIYEAAFFDRDNKQLPLSSESPLFDEQIMCEGESTFMNSTYFDEIYHARTAYEHIEYIPHYETTHPPLGKLIIGLGIRLFGMHPFGWRVMGNIAGILMLPVLYLFAKKLFKSSYFATVALLLFSFDFMHFSQTRIATIDSYPVLFILLMYYFMYLFYADCETLPRKKVCVYLLLSGISFGLAISSKWIGFYGGIGLCILFFVGLFRRIKKKNAKEFIICAFCILFFIAIPFIIYYISYIPIHIADKAESFWVNFWNYQKHMFLYHAELDASHPFASSWYTWPLVLHPIWYYGNRTLSEKGLVSSIVGMGNPIIWWASFASVIALIVYIIHLFSQKRKSHTALFIVIGYLSQLAPWIIISRCVFIYHYFASLPFAILALVYVFKKLTAKFSWIPKLIHLFLIISFILFIAFYPILSGAVIPKSYLTSALQWLSSWTIGY